MTDSLFVLELPRWDQPDHRGRRPVWNGLWMNARPHWRARQLATRQVIDAVIRQARTVGLVDVTDAEHLTVQLWWAPGWNTPADAHNLNLLVKAMVDGLARGSSTAPGLRIVPDDRDELVTVERCRIVRPRDAGNALTSGFDGITGLFLWVTVRHSATEALRGSLRPADPPAGCPPLETGSSSLSGGRGPVDGAEDRPRPTPEEAA